MTEESVRLRRTEGLGVFLGACNAPLQVCAIKVQPASGGPGFGVSPKFLSLSPKIGGQGVE